MQRIYSAVDAAEMIGCSDRTVRRWAAELGIGRRVGAVLVLTRQDISEISGRVREGPGNPNFGKPATAETA